MGEINDNYVVFRPLFLLFGDMKETVIFLIMARTSNGEEWWEGSGLRSDIYSFEVKKKKDLFCCLGIKETVILLWLRTWKGGVNGGRVERSEDLFALYEFKKGREEKNGKNEN